MFAAALLLLLLDHTTTVAFVPTSPLRKAPELSLPPRHRVKESVLETGGNKIHIREARFSDLRDVVTLTTNVFHPQFRSLTSYQARVKEKVQERMQGGAVLLLASRNEHGEVAKGNSFYGNIVGTVELCGGTDFRNTSMQTIGAQRKLYISNLAVREDARRLGLASSFMRTIEDYCKANSFEELYLHVNLGNDAGLQFYRRHGFTKIGNADWARHFTEARLSADADNFHFLFKSLRDWTSPELKLSLSSALAPPPPLQIDAQPSVASLATSTP